MFRLFSHKNRNFCRFLSSQSKGSSSKNKVVQNALSIKEFMASQQTKDKKIVIKESISIPSHLSLPLHQEKQTFFIETYGCQMNVNDSDLIRSILLNAGFTECSILEESDLVLTNTCAIREKAEDKVWNRLAYFQSLRTKNKLRLKQSGKSFSSLQGQLQMHRPIVGVLGCMAERLKERLLDEDSVDFVVGPDRFVFISF